MSGGGIFVLGLVFSRCRVRFDGVVILVIVLGGLRTDYGFGFLDGILRY